MNIEFKTKEELLQQLEKDWACEEGTDWVKAQESLEDVFNKCELDWRVWALIRGYVQFADKFDCTKFNEWDLVSILSKQPQLAGKFDHNKISGRGVLMILCHQPQFFTRQDWVDLLSFEKQNVKDDINAKNIILKKIALKLKTVFKKMFV